MKKDRSDWTVRKVTFSEAEELDHKFYGSLSEVERLEILMDLRSMIESDVKRMIPVVVKRHVHEEEKI